MSTGGNKAVFLSYASRDTLFCNDDWVDAAA